MPDMQRGTKRHALKIRIITIIITIIIITATASEEQKKRELWDVFVMAPDDPQALCVLTEAVCTYRQWWHRLVNRLLHYFVSSNLTPQSAHQWKMQAPW